MKAAGAVALSVGLSLVGVRSARGQADTQPAVPALVIEDFEETTLGSRPFLWRPPKHSAATAVVGVERAAVEGDAANKALKVEYSFLSAFAPDQFVEVGPQGQALPGSLTGVTMSVYGDGSKNAVALRLRDHLGESFEWQIPVTWTGWKRALVPLNPATALRGGTRQNGVVDAPVTFDAVRVVRTQAGAAKGEMMVDSLAAQCRFGKVTVLYDPALAVKPEEWQARRNRSVVGKTEEATVPRAGKESPALQLQYQYENGTDSSVEFQRTLPAGDGHGTLVAEVFGDGSNNVLRFRVLDGADHVWQATVPSVLVNWAGWKTLYLDTRTFTDPTGTDTVGSIQKFPLKFASVTIDDCSPKDGLPGVESGREGQIYLGRLFFCAEK
jgi:hypothetical protein